MNKETFWKLWFVAAVLLLIASVTYNVTAQGTVDHGDMIIDISNDLCRDANGKPVFFEYLMDNMNFRYLAANGDYVDVSWSYGFTGINAKRHHVKADACRKGQ